ncbi:MAG: alanine dehydrogenase [Candidatus Electryonea clarkiae]|nr:alanine dehydrogenase [Candidatus Electryonea clarkiae]MDP8286369.1 alanine dehydrogenase [Candidatus Electryonea clarkiae]
MIIGIPRERFVDERRVALSPAGVRTLVESGATVYVENDAGFEAGWKDSEYEQDGAVIAYNEGEAFQRADLLLKVLPPCFEEREMFREEQIVMSYLQLPLARREIFDSMVKQRVTAIGLENIENESGHPVRKAMSEIAGTLAVHNAVQYMLAEKGGRGILMCGAPGVPPASVGIIGAGVVGTAAAEAALNMGAHVILVDQWIYPLRSALQRFGNRLQTAVFSEHYLEKLCGFVDVLIGAVLLEDNPAPHMISRETIRSMKHRAVFVDVSIDQGGISETSRPSTISNPVYKDEGVIHFTVPNMPAQVPRTSTRAFQAQVLPFIKQIMNLGIKDALKSHPYMATGLNLFDGTVTRKQVGHEFDVDWTPIEEVLR